MFYSHRKGKARYVPRKLACLKNPTAGKTPDEYKDTWDQRTGVEWYHKRHKRNMFRHWPWAKWNDDPIRRHKSPACGRTFSVLCEGTNDGAPEWNYYKEVGEDYRVPSHYPTATMAVFLHTYCGKSWSVAETKDMLRRVQEKFSTIESVATVPGDVEAWNIKANAVPTTFLQHVLYLAEDMVLLNKKKEYRREQHRKGVLRTISMERYYALPYLQGAAMPTTLEQVPGKYYEGKFSTMMGGTKIHPLLIPDYLRTRAMYPA